MDWQFDDYSVNTDIALLDLDLIYNFLSKHSSWAQNISKELVIKSINNSINFALYEDGNQLGFARVITDKATFANLVDVFIIPQQQGKGLSHYLMQAIDKHPELQHIRRFTLATSTAIFLYKKYGFNSLSKPETMMERYYPNIYQEKKND